MRHSFLLLAALAACAGSHAPDPSTTSDAVSATQINGGTTGAMVRETTPAGFTCIDTTITIPDYDPTQSGAPWVYFGFGDERGADMEVGLAFQHGDGTPDKPHRWLPYMRAGSSFYFGGEDTRALPGDTFELTATFDGGAVTLAKDGQTLSLSGGGHTIDALPMPALDPQATHLRRVVGSAVSWRYSGQSLGTLGPVVFANTTACGADGSTQKFHDVAGWRDVRSGVIYGSVRFPSQSVSHTYDYGNDVDSITLFP